MDQLKELLYRLQDHPHYRKWADIPKPKKMLGFAIAGLAIALIILLTQISSSGTPQVELPPDPAFTQKMSTRENDRQSLLSMTEQALTDEIKHRKSALDEAKKANDPDRLRDAEDAWERANEVATDKKK